MREMRLEPQETLGKGFISPEFLPEGKNEYYLRDAASGWSDSDFKPLSQKDIALLEKNGNTADSWDNLLISDELDVTCVRNCQFFGKVRIAKQKKQALTYHDMKLPVGLYNNLIISCDIGENIAIHNVRYLAYTIIQPRVILFNINEINTTDHAKFGNGILRQGEDPAVRIELDLGNEAGGRNVMPFENMTAGDAWLWSRRRDDPELIRRFEEITQNAFGDARGHYSLIGTESVIKDCRVIKDVTFGPCCYVKGANKLKNLTIQSTPDEPTQIGEGVELVNGIISRGCKIFYGCKAVRFIMAPHSNLKYGARLIHSYLGDNATVSCCEVLNNLIFPAHEQHHNNSFLIASLVLGQSNIAAGATIGSNHNSRAPEGEIIAGRGFWPGLCTTLKHNCKFASFTLLAKGDYPAELNIPLPFSLISNDVSKDRLIVLPAFWWLYNTYALMRNSWKFRARDKRVIKTQNIEFDFLAPDSVEEIIRGLGLLEKWVGKAEILSRKEAPVGMDKAAPHEVGLDLLKDDPQRVDKLKVLGEGMEKSRRPIKLLKVAAAWRAYRDMLVYYGAMNLLEWLEGRPEAGFENMIAELAGPRETDWVNLGGQLTPRKDMLELCEQIKSGELNDWPAIHAAYDELWEKYPLQKQRHALAALTWVLEKDKLAAADLKAAFEAAGQIQQDIAQRTYESRKKDYENPFRQMTYANPEEMAAVLGDVEDNSFIQQVRHETAELITRLEIAAKRL